MEIKFSLDAAKQILSRTPEILNLWLSDLPEKWIRNNEGPETWSPFDIVGHLLHGEKTDWIARVKIILNQSGNRKFIPFNRFAQFEESTGKNLHDLLSEFSAARKANLEYLNSISFDDQSFLLRGIHPHFGEVTLKELLSTWVVHDLAHLNQITRVMAKQYKTEVGPWTEYFRILNS